MVPSHATVKVERLHPTAPAGGAPSRLGMVTAMRTTITILALAIILAACGTTSTTATTSTPSSTTVLAATTATTPAAPSTVTYKAFDQVNPRTETYFITLEKTTLAASQGQQRLWGLGVTTCQHLDKGRTIDTELASLTGDSKLAPRDAGAIIGAAAASICPQHRPQVDAYLKAHS